MKWFKHQAQANQDGKLKKVRMKYGLEGYGLYWYCLELIAAEVDTDKLTFELEHDSEILSFDLGIHEERIKEMMTYMVNLGLFEQCDTRITCFKLATMADEYLVKALSRVGKKDLLNDVRLMSGHSTDKVRPEKSRGEESKSREDKQKHLPDSQAKSDEFASQVNEVFEFWRNTLGKDSRTKLTQKRSSKVKARLKDGFTVAELCQAIEGCAKSPFHMGQNDTGAVHDDLELICRDDSKVKRFIGIANQSAQPYTATTANNINTLNDMEFD